MPQLKRPLITRDALTIAADTDTDTATHRLCAIGGANANRRPQQST